MTSNPYFAFAQRGTKTLQSLFNILEKAQTFARENGISEELLLKEHLKEDMFPLVKQVQIATDQLKGFVSKMTSSENIVMADTETTINELKSRIQKTVEFANSKTEKDYDGASEVQIVLPWMQHAMPGKYIPAQSYLDSYAYANFYFHIATAYGILRKAGVNLTKMDYIGGVEFRDINKA
jgi:uncharacterized protein